MASDVSFLQDPWIALAQHPGQGILGPAPAIYASQPTPLPSAFSTMPLQDPTWHMDTGASSHLNFNASNLSTIFDKRLFPSVHVGDGKSIPVTNTGHSIIPSHHRPLHLHNVLVTPNIIKNLISVRQFTRDNNCTIEFDAFGFSVKDYLTRHILLRCDSSSDLYPVTKPSTSPIAFLSTSASTWHQRLGHPGYPAYHRGFRCLNLETNKIILSRHVTFDETQFSYKSMTPSSPPSYTFLDTQRLPLLTSLASKLPNPSTNIPHQTSIPTAPPITDPTQSPPHTGLNSSGPTFPTNQPTSHEPNNIQTQTQNNLLPPPIFDPPNPQTNTNPINEPPHTHPMITRSQSGIVKPIERLSLHTSSLFPIHKSLFIALKDPIWCNAMYDEYNALVKNGTWILVPRPSDVNLVRSMWLLKHKFHADGTLSRYKARLVANGSNQQHGVDFDETFSPVVKPATIRTVLSLVVSRHWPIHQLDVKNAFLNGDLSKTVYMHQPPSFVDSCYPNHGSQVAYLLIYVDDIILTASSPVLLQQIKYARQLLERAHMVNCNPSRTPIDTDSKLGPDGVPVQEPHFAGLKRIMRYVQGTLELGLQLYASATTSLVGYTDADWAGCPSTRRSTSSYCVFLGDNLLSWSAKRQHTISRSSAEAEYRGVVNVVAETAWIRNLLRELHSPLLTGLLSGHVRVLHVLSRFQYADIFTKGLPSALFEDFCSSLSVRPPPTPTAGAY
ncbi:ribonuclease H-like domain-containing protein [Tanacetum coccineum]|uniref:Ribonuclease H-like domain-containing protein n=1 Tax=Tanacetum coccineum TaxID=301880 RepID=A0ABQ5D8G3_9ASTR